MPPQDYSHGRRSFDFSPKANDLLAAATERGKLTITVDRLEADITQLKNELLRVQGERDGLMSSTSWRLTSPLRRLADVAKHVTVRRRQTAPNSPARELSHADAPQSLARIDPEYENWVRTQDSLTRDDRAAISDRITEFSYHPIFSFILPLTSVDEQSFWITLATIEAQLYGAWELCIIAGSGCTFGDVARLRKATAKNQRIRWIVGAMTTDIGRLINSALGQAKGDFVLILPGQGSLAEDALFELAASVQTAPELDFIYFDEDWIDDHGQRLLPYFKPAWSIDLALGHDMVGNLAVYRRTALLAIGGARPGLASGHGYDISLRLGGATPLARIRHIPRILFHRAYGENGAACFSAWNMSEALAIDRAIAHDFLLSSGYTDTAVAVSGDTPLTTRVIWPIPDPAPLVSLIVPTRDHVDLITRCVAGLLHRTDYPSIELLIVDHESRDPETLAFLAHLQARDERVRILHFAGPFNYPAINNQAVREARGEVVVLVNNDIDVIGPGWLREMVSHALRPDVGAVGAKLLYEDGQIQHAGVVLGVGTHDGGPGVAGHFGHGATRRDIGYFGQYTVAREVSAVTGACMALRRDVYEAVGGLDEANLPISFNDVDFCLRIRERGWRIVWTPFAELYHLESRSRGADTTPDKIERAAREADYMRVRWGSILDNDPFYNANFDRRDHNFHLAFSGLARASRQRRASDDRTLRSVRKTRVAQQGAVHPVTAASN